MNTATQIAERAILGGVLRVPSRFVDVADKVEAGDFAETHHREIWKAFVSLDSASKPVDLVSVTELIEKAGGELLPYLKDLFNLTPSASSIEHYAELVKDNAVTRRLMEVGSEIMEIAKGQGDATGKLDKAQAKLMAVAETRVDDGPKAASEYLAEFIDDLDTRSQAKGGLVGQSTGLEDLDHKTAGLQDTDLVIVAGRPSMGKTTLAMGFAEQLVLVDQGTALVFSMEMSAVQLLGRMACSKMEIDFGKYRTGNFDDTEWTKMTSAMSQIRDSGLIIDETPALSILEVRTRARRAHRKTPLDMIVLDYIQLMSGDGENRNQAISEISRGLKALAKELKVPVIALSQLNRSVDSRQNKRPLMSDLRESGAIEQDADVICFVYRPEVYDEDQAPGLAELILRKQRNGETGTVNAVFQGHHCRFRNAIHGASVKEYEDQAAVKSQPNKKGLY